MRVSEAADGDSGRDVDMTTTSEGAFLWKETCGYLQLPSESLTGEDLIDSTDLIDLISLILITMLPPSLNAEVYPCFLRNRRSSS